MNRKIQADGFVIDGKLQEFIETKVDKLPTYFDKIIDVDIKLSLDSHQKIKDKTIHILCHIPQANLFAEATTKTFEESFDSALDDIKRQLKRKKELSKESVHSHKGGEAIAEDRDWEDYDD
jgi:putative sigma-54 modulation protein